MSTIERRVEHLEMTITSLVTIPPAIKDLGMRMGRLEARVDRVEDKVTQIDSKVDVLDSKIDKLTGDVAWIRKKLS